MVRDTCLAHELVVQMLKRNKPRKDCSHPISIVLECLGSQSLRNGLERMKKEKKREEESKEVLP